MLQTTDISATFSPNSISSSKSLGYGQLNICGIIISYTAYPSTFGAGFMLSLPSRAIIKNGVHEKDAQGKPRYFNEVYVTDYNVKGMLENAVLTAMANKGVHVQPGTSFSEKNSFNKQPSSQYSQQSGSSVSKSPDTFVNPHAAPTLATKPTISNPGASVVSADELPF